MLFYCKNCLKEFEISDTYCKGYYNWKCPECNHIANKSSYLSSPAVIWKCDTGTVPRNSASTGCNCSNCPNN